MKKTNTILCYTGRELFDEKGKSKGKIIRVKERLHYSDLLKTNSIGGKERSDTGISYGA